MRSTARRTLGRPYDRMPRGDKAASAALQSSVSKNLNPEKALIFRITHRANVRWIMANGLHCSTAIQTDPEFVPIGNSDLIGRRKVKRVPSPYGGFLSDYVPFYFTPFSPMLLNIVTGHGGITKQAKQDIVILVSSIWKLQEQGVQFVFSDRHAYLATARFSDNPADLSWIDWPLLQARNFKRDPDDPGKMERYEAEALDRGHVPTAAFLGAYTYNSVAAEHISAIVAHAGSAMRVIANAKMFF